MESLKYHPHIVCLLGYSFLDAANPLLALEYCANGDLWKFLRNNKEQFKNVSFGCF
jgi:hypothetical protein